MQTKAQAAIQTAHWPQTPSHLLGDSCKIKKKKVSVSIGIGGYFWFTDLLEYVESVCSV